MIAEFEIEEIKKQLEKIEDNLILLRAWNKSPTLRDDGLLERIEKLEEKLSNAS